MTKIARGIARRTLVRLALLALLALSFMAVAPATQAGPIELFQCVGWQTTILGTLSDDNIEGTPGNDVIIAFGVLPHDRILL